MGLHASPSHSESVGKQFGRKEGPDALDDTFGLELGERSSPVLGRNLRRGWSRRTSQLVLGKVIPSERYRS